jgi:hypothetical protein
LGQGLCAKIKLFLVQSVRRECNSFNRVAAPELSSLWVMGYFGMVPRFHGIGIASILSFPELQKVYGCVCMYVFKYACECVCVCVYINQGIKSDHVSLGVPVCLL